MTMFNKSQAPKESVGFKGFFALGLLSSFFQTMAFEESISQLPNDDFQTFQNHCQKLFSNSLFYEKTYKDLKSRFNEKSYMEKYRQDVIKSNLAPFEHFLNTALSGKIEPFLNTSFQEVLSGLEEKVQEASQEEWYVNIEKNKEIIAPYFDEAFYQEIYQDEVKQSGALPLDHFMNGGWQKGYKPTLWFESNLYQKYFPSKDNPFSDWLSQPSGVTTEKREQELIVSLTSYPSRDHVSWMAIESIMRQTVKADRIVLWLYEGQYPDQKIPQALEILKSRGLEIYFYNKDLKGGKKLIPTLKAFPNAVVVVADDDNFLERDWLEGLYNAHLQDPTSIYTDMVREIKIDPYGELAPYHEWLKIDSNNRKSDWLVPIGAGGILYPPSSLDREIFNEDLYSELCLDQDDLWAAIMAWRQGTPIKSGKPFELKSFENSQQEGLWNTVNRKGANDICIQRLNQYYGLGLPASRLKIGNFPFDSLKIWLKEYNEFEKSLNLKFNFPNSIKLFSLYQPYPLKEDSNDENISLLRETGALDIHFVRKQKENQGLIKEDQDISEQFIKHNLKRPNFQVNGLSYTDKSFCELVSSQAFVDYYSMFKPTYDYLLSNQRPDLLVPLANSMRTFASLSYQSDLSNQFIIPPKAHRAWINLGSEAPEEALKNFLASYQRTSQLEQNFWCLDPAKIPQTVAFLKNKMPNVRIRKVEELFENGQFREKAFYDSLMQKKYYTIASDIVRLNILSQEGGFYSNIGNALWMDVAPLLSNYEFIIYSRPKGRFWDTNFTACPANSKILEIFWSRLENWSCDDDCKTAFSYGAHGFLGGPLLTDILYDEWVKGLNLLVLPDCTSPYRNHSLGSWYGKGKNGNATVKRSMFLEFRPDQKLKRLCQTLNDAILENKNYTFLLSSPLSIQTPFKAYKNAVLVIAFKDEEDIIFENLAWHYSIGIRNFFLMDNLSTDSSVEKVRKFQKLVEKDANVFLLQDPIVEHIQGNKTTGAIKFAQEIFPGLQWALPTDADEFWCPVTSLDNIFSKVPQEVDAIFASLFFYQSSAPKDLLSQKGKSFYETLTFKTTVNPHAALGDQWNGKSIIRLPLKEKVVGGNHFIATSPDAKEAIGNYISGSAIGIHIREYPLRSLSQFIKKVVNKGRAKEKANSLGIRPKTSHFTEKRYQLFLERGISYLQEEFEKTIKAGQAGAEDPLPIEEALETVTRNMDSVL